MGFYNKQCFLVIITCLVVFSATSQIKVSEFLQKSEIATPDGNKLFFVDFWATWCVPCITAKEHLKVLQSQFPNDFYVVSLSSENPVRVEQFLDKNPNKLAVAIDYNKETFEKYNTTKILPDGVLFNARGKVLWQGGAPDLKKDDISRFLRQQKSSTSADSFFEVMDTKEESVTEYTPSKSIEIKLLSDITGDLNVVDNDRYLKLNGSLKSIISYLAEIYKDQIELKKELDSHYEVYFKKPLNTHQNIAYKLIEEMKLGISRKFEKGEGISFSVENPKFWDTNQIDWGKNNAKYLIGDSSIKADNVSLKNIAYKLAHVLGMPVIVPDNTEISLPLHDWDFHYKFFKLMQADLKDNYGIVAEKKILSYPIYQIQKKAP